MSKTRKIPSEVVLVGILTILKLPASSASENQATSEEYWYRVSFNSNKVGYYRVAKIYEENMVLVNSELSVNLKGHRKKEPFTVFTQTVEHLDNGPMSFAHRTKAAHMDITRSGTIADGTAKLQVDRNGILTQRTRENVPNILFPHAQSKLIKSAIQNAAREVTFNSFDFADHVTHRYITQIEPTKDSHGQEAYQLTTFRAGDEKPSSVSWVNANAELQSMTSELLGKQLKFSRTNEKAARSKSGAIAFLDTFVFDSPNRIPKPYLRKTIRYQLSFPAATLPALPATAEQSYEYEKNTVWLDVCLNSDCGATNKINDIERRQALTANEWIQSDHPEIMHAARRFENIASPKRRMNSIVEFVKRKMDTKKYDFVGETTALEALRSGSGDCTEYSLLVAALARATGIPSRIVSGIAYSNRFNQQTYVFAPHAWTQVWIDNQWQSFDAAKESYGSGHIALYLNQGDPEEIRNALKPFEGMMIRSSGVLTN